MSQMEFDLGHEVTVRMPLTEMPALEWSLAPYSGKGKETSCRKCYGDQIATTYHQQVLVGSPCWTLYQQGPLRLREQVSFPEHLDRVCLNCRYAWVERTVDSEGD